MSGSTTAATVSRWSRRYVLAGALFLVAWQACAVAGVGRRTAVALGLYGFVVHVLVGKAYALVPTYFARKLAVPLGPAVGFPATAGGVVALAAGSLPGTPAWLDALGAVAWAMGIAVFLGTLAWTVRDNLTGGETGTGEHNAARRSLDRFANAFVPVALGYLALAAWTTAAAGTPLPTPLDGYPPRASHLLAAGAAVLLVLAIGARLLPRFLVANPPRGVLAVALPAGAVAPALLATGVGGTPGPWLALGAAGETVAVAGFALAYWTLFARSDRRRVGLYAVLPATLAGLVGVGVGLLFVTGVPTATLVRVHLRANVLGFLGLTIVGLSYQFYPPAIGTTPGATDRTAFVSIGCLAGGLGVEIAAAFVGIDSLVGVGEALALVGAVLYAYLLASAFRAA